MEFLSESLRCQYGYDGWLALHVLISFIREISLDSLLILAVPNYMEYDCTDLKKYFLCHIDDRKHFHIKVKYF